MTRRYHLAMLIAGEDLVPVSMLDAVAAQYEQATLAQSMEQMKHNRDMVAQFLIELDRPEDHDTLRETLHAALVDLSDHVARLEEHVG